MRRGLAALRRATAQYHRVSVAQNEDWVTPFPCLDPSPFGQGGLGIPYVKPARVGDGELSVDEPGILFYEPQKNGRLRLVGVEVVIPISQWEGGSPPTFSPPTFTGPGPEFHKNEAEGLYGIHAWVWLHNPNGMFEGGNTRVSCEFAE